MNIILIIIILLLLFGGGGGIIMAAQQSVAGSAVCCWSCLSYTCLWEGVKLHFIAPAFYARQRSSPAVTPYHQLRHWECRAIGLLTALLPILETNCGVL